MKKSNEMVTKRMQEIKGQGSEGKPNRETKMAAAKVSAGEQKYIKEVV